MLKYVILAGEQLPINLVHTIAKLANIKFIMVMVLVKHIIVL